MCEPSYSSLSFGTETQFCSFPVNDDGRRERERERTWLIIRYLFSEREILYTDATSVNSVFLITGPIIVTK